MSTNTDYYEEEDHYEEEIITTRTSKKVHKNIVIQQNFCKLMIHWKCALSNLTTK